MFFYTYLKSYSICFILWKIKKTFIWPVNVFHHCQKPKHMPHMSHQSKTAGIWKRFPDEDQDRQQVMKPMWLVATLLKNYWSITQDSQATMETILHAKNWENIKHAMISTLSETKTYLERYHILYTKNDSFHAYTTLYAVQSFFWTSPRCVHTK